MGRAVMAELVAEQVEGPIWILAAAYRLADQHAMPNNLLLGRILLCSRLAADHQAKLAILEIDVAGLRLRHPSAMVTRRPDHDGLARWALAQLRLRAGLALVMRRVFGTAIGGERPDDVIFRQAVTEHSAAVIENDGIGFAFGRAQHAADHLPK